MEQGALYRMCGSRLRVAVHVLPVDEPGTGRIEG